MALTKLRKWWPQAPVVEGGLSPSAAAPKQPLKTYVAIGTAGLIIGFVASGLSPNWGALGAALVDARSNLQNFFWAAAAGGLAGAFIRWVNGLNRPAAAAPKKPLKTYIAIGSMAGIVAVVLAQRWEVPVPSWDWVSVGALGALVGIGELASRYRDEPVKALLNAPAILYVLLNAGAAIMALALGRAFIWKDVNASPVDWTQVLTAGLGAMVLLRSSVFRVKVGKQDVDIGPSSFLQSVIDAADRAVDRVRAQERAWTVASLMANVNPGMVVSLLPSYFPVLMQNLKDEDQKKFNEEAAKIEQAVKNPSDNPDLNALKLGLLVMNYGGGGVLRAALTSLARQITLQAQDTVDAAEQAKRAAAELEARAEEMKVGADETMRKVSQTSGTPTEIKEAAQQLAERATSITAVAHETSDKARETTKRAEMTALLATTAIPEGTSANVEPTVAVEKVEHSKAGKADLNARSTESQTSDTLIRSDGSNDRQQGVHGETVEGQKTPHAAQHELSAGHPILSRPHPMNLKVGVLIVGSLDWESKCYGGAIREELERHGREPKPDRVAWRNSRLMGDDASEFPVKVPIRYGRLSRTRNNTYTMVFCPSYKQGTAKVIRCKRAVRSIADLTEEAEALWKAEGGKSGVSAGWGCVALITPEAFLNNPDGDNRQMLLDAWQKHISGVRSYGRFQFSQNDEKFVGKGKKVIEGGRLKIPWPTPSDGRPLDLDLILATVTKPEIDKRKDYPSTETIARAWNKNDHVYYFWCNRWAGIQTADDDAIEKLLHRRNVRSPRSHRDGLTFR